jgi:rfaE bifunctional protein nucleotidyltransferase chain/domain
MGKQTPKTTLRLLQKKILSPNAAKRATQAARRAGKKVVFTNGCFDILHPGHVSYLQQARRCGGFLVVALDTDESVRMLKGPTRPINPLESRLQVIAALESVDAVTWFGEGNPVPLMQLLKPHLIVKGGDWKVQQILGWQEVREWGGRTRSLPYVAGKSTTELIKKIVAVSA